MKEIFATLSETYVRMDRYLEEILVLIRKMPPIDENDHVGLETFYVHILALCVESGALNMFHHVANPLVTAMFVDRFPLSEIRDWDSYRNGEGLNFPNEFRAMEQFCRDRLPGVRRLADRQKTCAAVEPQQQHKQNWNHGQRDFTGTRGMRETLSMTEKGNCIGLTVRPQMWPRPVSRSAPQKKRLLLQN